MIWIKKGPAGGSPSRPTHRLVAQIPRKPPNARAIRLASVSRDDGCLAPVEAIIDAEFDRVDVLLDCHRSAQAAKSSSVRAREEQVTIAESVQIVFENG